MDHGYPWKKRLKYTWRDKTRLFSVKMDSNHGSSRDVISSYLVIFTGFRRTAGRPRRLTVREERGITSNSIAFVTEIKAELSLNITESTILRSINQNVHFKHKKWWRHQLSQTLIFRLASIPQETTWLTTGRNISSFSAKKLKAQWTFKQHFGFEIPFFWWEEIQPRWSRWHHFLLAWYPQRTAKLQQEEIQRWMNVSGCIFCFR